MWLVVTEIHLSIEFWWIVCAYVITIYGAINRRVLSKLWPINLRSVDCGFCRGKAEFSTPKKLKRNTVLHRYVSSFSFAKHFQLHLYTFRRFVRFLIIPLAALSLSLLSNPCRNKCLNFTDKTQTTKTPKSLTVRTETINLKMWARNNFRRTLLRNCHWMYERQLMKWNQMTFLY